MAHTTLATHRRNASATTTGSLLHRAAQLVALWRSRRVLAGLPAERLDDLGLTADEARREAQRAPWDVPGHWLK